MRSLQKHPLRRARRCTKEILENSSVRHIFRSGPAQAELERGTLESHKELLAGLGRELDFEDAGPQFSSNEQAFMNWIVGDAVQDGFWLEAIDWAK